MKPAVLETFVQLRTFLALVVGAIFIGGPNGLSAIGVVCVLALSPLVAHVMVKNSSSVTDKPRLLKQHLWGDMALALLLWYRVHCHAAMGAIQVDAIGSCRYDAANTGISGGVGINIEAFV